eukprot:CAMPEP_0116148258 /NCGR_PEP_ID=MMETSP0329-20121206/18254_1 /TAXON_ID=697910 /ORGANISM="Pseudo-nitzschia arenysensis, Strain B593" /LENGTH=246 /DNA_ID=CAMNT_0003644365 /DNA_START=80 /DNA_END=820 /DNA_ORIENTATION=+
MTAFKRKNEHVEDVASQLTKMVIVGDSNEKENTGNQESPAVNLTAIERMKRLSAQWEPEPTFGGGNADSIAQSFGSIVDDKTNFEKHNSLLEKAEGIKHHLSTKIEKAKDMRTKETSVLGELSLQLNKFHEQRQCLLGEIDDLDARQRVSQEKIAMYQAEASQELDLILDVEEEQKQQVPRLKMTISLYASTTGIKWDFEDPDLLAGQVEIPSQCSFKRFNIDPRDYSSVETADMLWHFMEGDEVH